MSLSPSVVTDFRGQEPKEQNWPYSQGRRGGILSQLQVTQVGVLGVRAYH